MSPEATRERDLVLAQGEQALLQDGASGDVITVVGPQKSGLQDTDAPVIYQNGRFEKCADLRSSIRLWPAAKEGQYIVLTNPVLSDPNEHPPKGKPNTPILAVGRKVNIPGPITFATWAGQTAEVIDGHILRSNQYLLVRIINGEEAMSNWGGAVLKKQAPTENGKGESADSDAPEKDEKATPATITSEEVGIPKLVTGQLLIVKGTDLSFYIPSTGIEVVRDTDGNYVREAVTLEQLEYCILRGESGRKAMPHGPDVIFPEPTEVFLKGPDGERKFRAIELEEHKGIYIKVIKAYDEGDEHHEEGDELFITGAEQKIYFPREEHCIIKYGDQEVHFATAIPAGEGRYVLDRRKGGVDLVRGPRMFLPDPRHQVLVKRALDPKLISLLYPDNNVALEYNQELEAAASREKSTTKGAWMGSSSSLRSKRAHQRDLRHSEDGSLDTMYAAVDMEAVPEQAGSELLMGGEFSRSIDYTPLRTIQLGESKYAGAVRIGTWTGYAVKIVDASGKSRVVAGPETTLLEYGELPEVFSLSTEKPKNTDHLVRDVYLRITANAVSDVIQCETADFVKVDIPIIYRVNFEGNEEKWFNVENYVKFLTDHIRSLVSNLVKQVGIEEFSANYINLLRDLILGKSGEKGERPGRPFSENGMRIYDVEFVKRLVIGDAEIGDMLQTSQHDTVRQTLELAKARKRLESTKENEKITREVDEARSATRTKTSELSGKAIREDLTLALAEIESAAQQVEQTLAAKLAEQDTKGKINEFQIARDKATGDLSLGLEEKKLELTVQGIKAEAEAIVTKAKAISPNLVAALQIFGDKALAEKMAETMAPLAIIGGKSIADVFGKLIKGTSAEKALMDLLVGDQEPGKKESASQGARA